MSTVLYRVIEKSYAHGRRAFAQVGGVWHPNLKFVREIAGKLAEVSLAHRFFIESSERGIVEELELPPLAERMAKVHRSCLRTKAPERLAAEEQHLASMPAWRQRVPMSRRPLSLLLASSSN